MENTEVATLIMRRIVAVCKDRIECEEAFRRASKTDTGKLMYENRIDSVRLLIEPIIHLVEIYTELMDTYVDTSVKA